MEMIIDILLKNDKLISSSIAILGFGITLATFIKAVLEYKVQGSQRRAELFLKLKNELITEPWAVQINRMVEIDSPQLNEIDLMERYRYLGFFETVSIAHNSGLINSSTVYYMFGYFAIRCYESQQFWIDINKNSFYWSEFCRFAMEMKAIERRLANNSGNTSSLGELRF